MGLVFGGQDFSEYGVVIDSAETWPKPVRDRKTVHVPGRNGDLILDNYCYQNVEITYHCLIKDGWKEKFIDFCIMLYQMRGYHELFDDNHPGVYRMAEFAGPISPELWFTTETGVFDLAFNCKPQQYISPSQSYVLDFSTQDAIARVDNTYGMAAYPLFRVIGASNGALITIGETGPYPWYIQIASNNFYGIEIDCEAETCTAIDEGGTAIANANSYVTITPPDAFPIDQRDFPYIGPAIGYQILAAHSHEGVTYSGTLVVEPRFTRI